ncbi:hypothetical protein [Kutzneria sp. CA-103260]|uniref:hypothetical protein n=1 Tax=Kutzneria sp. CA-103260 TaxID=2802641 RepID=UPI001BA53A97|nr:hypothetical protein [Kutzneria sp. CA-103260]QUQ68503.1 hypothetical protein JJ691_62490 [Kutzneria sp. CA-103260]
MTVVTTHRAPVSDRAVVVLLVAVAAGLVLARRLYRDVEIALAGLATPSVHTGQAGRSAYLLVPLLLTVSVVVALWPRTVRKALVALGFTTAALAAVDVLAVLLGSLAGVLGGMASLVLFGWLAVRREKL